MLSNAQFPPGPRVDQKSAESKNFEMTVKAIDTRNEKCERREDILSIQHGLNLPNLGLSNAGGNFEGRARAAPFRLLDFGAPSSGRSEILGLSNERRCEVSCLGLESTD